MPSFAGTLEAHEEALRPVSDVPLGRAGACREGPRALGSPCARRPASPAALGPVCGARILLSVQAAAALPRGFPPPALSSALQTRGRSPCPRRARARSWRPTAEVLPAAEERPPPRSARPGRAEERGLDPTAGRGCEDGTRAGGGPCGRGRLAGGGPQNRTRREPFIQAPVGSDS